MMKRILTGAIGLMMAFAVAGCFDHESDVVSKNLSYAADQFDILRRIVFYNGITGEYMLTIEGYCALGNQDAEDELTVTCEIGKANYKKHFLGLSDNVTYFVEQLNSENVSREHYEVRFKPSLIVPDINVE